MKKISFLIFTFILSCSWTANAQEHHYITGEDVTAGGITFDVKNFELQLSLCNVQNEKINQRIVYTNGEEVTYEDYSRLSFGDIKRSSLYKAVAQTFTEEECMPMISNNDQIDFIFVVLADGSIGEVSFCIKGSPRMFAITPEKYALLEQNIKQYVTVEAKEDLQRVQFCRMVVMFRFEWMKDYYTIKKKKSNPDFDGGAISGL